MWNLKANDAQSYTSGTGAPHTDSCNLAFLKNVLTVDPTRRFDAVMFALHTPSEL